MCSMFQQRWPVEFYLAHVQTQSLKIHIAPNINIVRSFTATLKSVVATAGLDIIIISKKSHYEQCHCFKGTYLVGLGLQIQMYS